MVPLYDVIKNEKACLSTGVFCYCLIKHEQDKSPIANSGLIMPQRHDRVLP